MGQLAREEYDDVLLEIEERARSEAVEVASKTATERNVLLPYEPEHIKAQMLMALVIDPETSRPMRRGRVAELCGINRVTLWKWINDGSRGGKAAWYAAVERYARGYLESFIPMLLRILQEEVVTGKNRVGAGRLLLQYAGKLQPGVVVDVKAEATVAPTSRVMVVIPDNGRNRATNPDGVGFREVAIAGPAGAAGEDGEGREGEDP